MKQFSKKYIIKIPGDVSVFYCNKKNVIILKGSDLQKSLKLKTKIYVSTLKKFIVVTKIPFLNMSNAEKKSLKLIQNTTIALIKQIILEVSVLLCIKLKFIGVGYRVFPIETFNNHLLHLRLGYSHQIYFKVPKDLTVSCIKFTNLFIFGNSYQYVNQIASIIRSYKLPEPYKGKGILYENEKVILKEGKKA